MLRFPEQFEDVGGAESPFDEPARYRRSSPTRSLTSALSKAFTSRTPLASTDLHLGRGGHPDETAQCGGPTALEKKRTGRPDVRRREAGTAESARTGGRTRRLPSNRWAW